MFKKTMLFIFWGMLMLNLCGCFALFIGAAGGAGTAIWLSGKLTQEFHASYHATINATRLALQSLNLSAVKETLNENVTQFRGSYVNGSEMWIDIHRVTEYSTKVEVRIGGITPYKEADSLVLDKIQSFI